MITEQYESKWIPSVQVCVGASVLCQKQFSPAHSRSTCNSGECDDLYPDFSDSVFGLLLIRFVFYLSLLIA